MNDERYYIAFDIAASVFKQEMFAPAPRWEPAIALYLIIGAGKSIQETATLSGWSVPEVVAMVTPVEALAECDERFARMLGRLSAKMLRDLEKESA